MRFGSLFAGIGGMDLGLERAGMTCAWQVEIDEHAQRILAKHWPAVPRFSDVREVGAHCLEPVDLICGGFPCQDVSDAGKRAGIDGARSGLWSEFARIIRELRPRYVLVENVAALLVRGVGRVLGDLAESGYDAEWDCIPAHAVGSPQRRDRLFIVAHRDGLGCEAGAGVFDPDALAGVQSEDRFVGWVSSLERGRSGRIWPVPRLPLHGMADGVPPRVDRLRGLGNAVVPQVAELIGRRILAHAEAA